MSFRCPWCGSPVTVRGHRWECGWCGDFGDLSSLPSARRAAADWKHKERAEQINQALPRWNRGVFDSGGDEGLLRREEGARGASLEADGLRDFQEGCAPPLGKAGSGAAGAARAFLQSIQFWTQRSSGHCPGWYGGLCPEFALSKEQLGTFWQALLPQIPACWLRTLSGLTGYGRILEGLCAVGMFLCAGRARHLPRYMRRSWPITGRSIFTCLLFSGGDGAVLGPRPQ